MAWTRLTNSTTADADEVHGDLVFIGAGTREPYYENTAGTLIAVDNTYDLGSSTNRWKTGYVNTLYCDSWISSVTSISGNSITIYADSGVSIWATNGSVVIKASNQIVLSCGGAMDFYASTTVNGSLKITGGMETQDNGMYFYVYYYSIGSWDMDASTTKVVSTANFQSTNIISCHAQIFHDDTTYSYDLMAATGASIIVQYGIGSTYLLAPAGCIFDNTSFNNTGINRGYLTIMVRN